MLFIASQAQRPHQTEAKALGVGQQGERYNNADHRNAQQNNPERQRQQIIDRSDNRHQNVAEQQYGEPGGEIIGANMAKSLAADGTTTGRLEIALEYAPAAAIGTAFQQPAPYRAANWPPHFLPARLVFAQTNISFPTIGDK